MTKAPRRAGRRDPASKVSAPALRRAAAAPERGLEPVVRREMEDRFGHDFRRVRVHREPPAARFASSLHARAVTVGRDVFFAPGQYRPRDPEGRHLLAHELAHTIQQRRGRPAPGEALDVASPGDASERQAEAAARGAPSGDLQRALTLGGPLRAQRFLEHIPLLGFFVERELDEPTLRRYLARLDRTGEIEGGHWNDDMARQIAAAWSSGSTSFELPVRRKALLVREMLDGFVSPDDQEQILELLERSEALELDFLFGPGGVRHADLLAEFGWYEDELHAFYRRRYYVERDETPTASGLAGQQASGVAIDRGEPLPDPEGRVFDPFLARTTTRRRELPTLARIDRWVDRLYGASLPPEKRPRGGKGYLERETSLELASPDRDTGRFEEYLEHCRELGGSSRQCEQQEPTVQGFFDPEQGRLVVRHERGGARPAVVVHEALHAYEHEATRGLNKFAREGLVEYLTRRLVERSAGAIDQRLVGSQAYPGPYQAALELSLIVGEAPIARAVFQGALGELERKLGREPFRAWNEALASEEGWRQAVAVLRRL